MNWYTAIYGCKLQWLQIAFPSTSVTEVVVVVVDGGFCCSCLVIVVVVVFCGCCCIRVFSGCYFR